MADERPWTIYDIDGSNPRVVTLAEFKEYHRQKCEEAKKAFVASVVVVQKSK